MKGLFDVNSKHLILSVVVALAGFLPQSKASLVDLGTAGKFAVLAGSSVTFTAPTTTVIGGVGVSPETSITGTPANLSQTGGTLHYNDAVAVQAQSDATAAYGVAAGATTTTTFSGTENQLGGQTLVPGVYKFGHGDTANLNGTLTLDAKGDPDPEWIFQATSDLVTASGSQVVLLNGATPCDVFWQVTSTAKLGPGSFFDGTILALTSITLGNGVTVNGRLLAQTAEVTLIHDFITASDCSATVPEPSTLLGGAFCVSVFGWQWLAGCRRKAGRS